MVGQAFDRQTVDLKRSCLRLSENLLFVPQNHGGQLFYHIESAATAKFYRIGYREYLFVSLLDGETSFVQALAITAQHLGADALSEGHAWQVYHWLIEHKLARFAEQGIESRNPRKTPGLLQRFNPFCMKWSWGSPDHALRIMEPYLGWIFHPVAIAAAVVLMIAAAATVTANYEQFANSSEIIFAPTNWIWMLITWVTLKFIHELSHGIACKRFGGAVRDTGVIFILFAPLAFVDVTSTWSLASKWKRILVAAAGMYVELTLAALATFFWVHSSSEVTAHLLFNVIIMASASTLLFNANPLMRFDGYYILSDLLEIPNLYSEGRRVVQSRMRQLFVGSQGTAQLEISGTRRVFISVYGFAAAIWRLLICASLGIAAAVMFEGAGIVLTVIGMVTWFLQPLQKAAIDLYQRYHERRLTFVRACVVTTTLALVAWGSWSLVPSPSTVSIPGILDYQGATVIRSQSSGFVRDILVANGQRVETGQSLVQLRNLELEDELTEIRESLEQSRVRQRIARQQKEVAQVQIETRMQESLRTRLQQKQQSLERLVIKAPTAGRVVARRLDETLGTYLHEGDEILSIGDEARKELVLSVSQDDIDELFPRLGDSFGVRVGSRPAFSARLGRIEPRATTDLPHPALAATAGGPLPVKEHAEQSKSDKKHASVELSRPRFRAIAYIDPADAQRLFSGERAQANFGSRHERLGEWIYGGVADWIEKKLELVTPATR